METSPSSDMPSRYKAMYSLSSRVERTKNTNPYWSLLHTGKKSILQQSILHQLVKTVHSSVFKEMITSMAQLEQEINPNWGFGEKKKKTTEGWGVKIKPSVWNVHAPYTILFHSFTFIVYQLCKMICASPVDNDSLFQFKTVCSLSVQESLHALHSILTVDHDTSQSSLLGTFCTTKQLAKCPWSHSQCHWP